MTKELEATAQGIVVRYHQRRLRGECRVDDKLFLDLCQVLPEKTAQEIFAQFRKRRAHSDPRAEFTLGVEIGIALHDAEHFASTAKPVVRLSEREKVAARPGMRLKEIAEAKVMAGEPLTEDEEDAMLWG
jgi:hypothetical protein